MFFLIECRGAETQRIITKTLRLRVSAFILLVSALGLKPSTSVRQIHLNNFAITTSQKAQREAENYFLPAPLIEKFETLQTMVRGGFRKKKVKVVV